MNLLAVLVSPKSKSYKFICLSLIFFTGSCLAQNDNSQKFDKYTAHYSVFSSTSLSAEMAKRYNLIRGKDRVYVNVAIVPNEKAFGGVKAKVTGFASNLMQQQKSLNFQEIAEKDAVYYLAVLRHTNHEVFHFTLDINLAGLAGPYQIKFSKELYVNP